MSFQLKYSFKYVKRKYLETELENVKLYNNTLEKYQVSTEAIHQNLQIFFIIFVLLETGIFLLLFSETGSHFVVHAILELTDILLLQALNC